MQGSPLCLEKNAPLHTVSSQDFCSFSFSVISVINFQHYILTPDFFREIAMLSSNNFSFNNFFLNFLFLKILIASYGARVRGNVFKMEFRVLFREFESIETSPGFAQLLG